MLVWEILGFIGLALIVLFAVFIFICECSLADRDSKQFERNMSLFIHMDDKPKK